MSAVAVRPDSEAERASDVTPPPPPTRPVPPPDRYAHKYIIAATVTLAAVL